jgi:hypothetical protein
MFYALRYFPLFLSPLVPCHYLTIDGHQRIKLMYLKHVINVYILLVQMSKDVMLIFGFLLPPSHTDFPLVAFLV